MDHFTHRHAKLGGESVALRALADDLGTPAYGFAMASNHHARLRAVEVLVDGSHYTVVRRRETYEDLVAGETIL